MISRIELIEKLKIEKKPFVDKLVSQLFEKHNITYQDNEGILDNVIFIKDDKVFKIYHEMFFRYSGRSVYMNNDDKMERLDDKMFYEWIKMLVLFHLGIDVV